jgi:hypothetical protein
MKNVYYLYDLCLFSQIVIMERRRNFLAEMGVNDWDAQEQAQEFMCEAIKTFFGDEMTEDTVDFSDVVTEDEYGNYFDILNPENIICEDRAKDIAVWWSNEQGKYYLSTEEIAEIQNYFEELASHFPSLREEFEENAIL